MEAEKGTPTPTFTTPSRWGCGLVDAEGVWGVEGAVAATIVWSQQHLSWKLFYRVDLDNWYLWTFRRELFLAFFFSILKKAFFCYTHIDLFIYPTRQSFSDCILRIYRYVFSPYFHLCSSLLYVVHCNGLAFIMKIFLLGFCTYCEYYAYL